MTFDRDQIRNDIKTALGEEQVPVELGEKAIDLAINRTLEMLNRYKPVTIHHSYQVQQSGMYKHDCPSEVTGISFVELTPGISSLISSGSLAIESAMLTGAPIYYGVGDTFWDIEYLDLRRRWLKTVQRELGADPDYATLKDPDTQVWSIYTFATAPILVDAQVVITHNQNLSTIQDYNQKWFFDYALAYSKGILGRARGKYDAIPVAGTSVTLDGKELLREAQEDMKELESQLQGSRADLYPRWA